MGFVSLLETIFKCPRTGQDLVLEKSNSNDLQQNDIFVSVDKNNKYPIINGVQICAQNKLFRKFWSAMEFI